MSAAQEVRIAGYFFVTWAVVMDDRYFSAIALTIGALAFLQAFWMGRK